MSFLLDTQVWLWMLITPDRLSSAIRRLVTPAETPLVLSAVSTLEIAIKYQLDKLRLPGDPADAPEWMARTKVEPLAILHRHTLHVATLPLHHRDPFDRLLIAQAQLEHLTLVTRDRHFERYDVRVLRA